MNFKDLIGFVEQGMDLSASHLVSRKEFCHTDEKFLKRGKRGGKRTLLAKNKLFQWYSGKNEKPQMLPD